LGAEALILHRSCLIFRTVDPLQPPQTKINRLGGGERDRTDDLMLAKHALYQLSYTPKPGPKLKASGAE
jgi:hypothetical protein